MAKKRHLTQYDSSGNQNEIYLNDDEVMTGGQTLGEKMGEIDEALGGSVTAVKMNNGTPIEPDENGVVNLGKVITQHQDISGKVDKETGKGLSSNDYTTAEKTKLAGLPTGSELNTTLGNKANAADVVKSISVNGTAQQKDAHGNVNITVSGGSASQEISILFVGNSLTQDAVSYLPLVLKEIAPNLTFNIYMWYDGGYTLTQILAKWNNDTAAEKFSTCENVTSWTNADGTQKMAAFLASGKTFDIVCLEEYFNYKRTTGYTAEDKQSFNDAVAYIRSHYDKPFKVVSFFHRPLCKDTNNQVDLSIADEVYGLTYDGVRWQLENTISEGVVPSGIASYRAMYDNVLNGLGDKGYMSPDGTHSQEGLPCLMQAWVTALWVLGELSIPTSINNAQGRVTSANYASINVPGANLGNGVVVGTTAQDQEAMDVAIKAFKEGKRLEMNFLSPNGIPPYKIEVAGGSGTQTERTVRLTASVLPSDASADIVWSIVSGDASVNNGLVTYNGSARTASVVVRAKIDGKNLKTDSTLSFSLAAVETPVFSPVAGEYAVGQAVAISCATAGATIYYTTDGSTPTASSTEYTAPITINADTTLKAIAILGNESSNVATAEYTVATPKLVTVNVTDGESAVSGATVVLNNGTSDIQPTSSSGGAYQFSVMAGVYTIKVSKTGFIPSEEVINATADTSKTVTIRSTDLLRYALVGNAGCMGNNKPAHPLYPVIMSAASDGVVNLGAYLQVFEGDSRCGILIPKSNAELPVTWQNWRSGDAIYGGETLTEAKSMYSFVEWPLDVDEIEIKLTNPDYYLAGKVMSKNNTDFYAYSEHWQQGGQNCVFRLNRTNCPTAFYVGIWFKYLDAGTTWPSPSLSTLGLSVTAIVD